MSIDPQLPKDPTSAAAMLASLEEKDKDETRCSYPTCYELRQAATGSGRPSAYCSNPRHTAVTNHRARQQLKAIVASGSPEAVSKRENPLPGVANVESLRSSVVSGMLQLQDTLERYVTTLTEIADPDVSAAQIRAAQERAEARIAEAQQSVNAERSLRLAAESASIVVQKEAQTAREAAEQAIQCMEEAETRMQQQMEETKRQIAEIQAERDAVVDHVRVEAQHRIEETEKQAREAIALAQEEARQADTRASEALAQAATAERLVNEAHTTLERERAEIDRLRAELAATVKDARAHAEADRTEARVALERERTEIDRLRAELVTTRKQAEQATVRADQLAVLTDELRTQFVQIQMGAREKTSQQ